MKAKQLFIIRHAKAEDFMLVPNDYNRNLIEKGILRAAKNAEILKEKIQIEDKSLFISSSANRAIQTAEIFSAILNYPTDAIVQTKNIYEAYYKEILKEINKVSNSIDTLFIFGHNPGLSDLTNYLCNTNISLNTSAVAVITVEKDINFNELSGNTASLNQIISE